MMAAWTRRSVVLASGLIAVLLAGTAPSPLVAQESPEAAALREIIRTARAQWGVTGRIGLDQRRIPTPSEEASGPQQWRGARSDVDFTALAAAVNARPANADVDMWCPAERSLMHQCRLQDPLLLAVSEAHWDQGTAAVRVRVWLPASSPPPGTPGVGIREYDVRLVRSAAKAANWRVESVTLLFSSG